MAFQQEGAFSISEVIDEKGGWRFFCLLALFGGKDGGFLGLGDFCNCSEDLALHSFVLGDVQRDIIKGNGQELPPREFLPFANKIDADMVEGGCGVSVVDLWHVGTGVFIDGFTWGAPVGGGWDATSCCSC